jgi:hypothetical protein
VIAFTVFCGTLSRDFLVFVIVNAQLSSCALGHQSEQYSPKYTVWKFEFSCFLSWRYSVHTVVGFYTLWSKVFLGRFRGKALKINMLGRHILSTCFCVFLKHFLGSLKRANYTTWISDIQSARYCTRSVPSNILPKFWWTSHIIGIFKVKHAPELNCLSKGEDSSLFETPKNTLLKPTRILYYYGD